MRPAAAATARRLLSPHADLQSLLPTEDGPCRNGDEGGASTSPCRWYGEMVSRVVQASAGARYACPVDRAGGGCVRNDTAGRFTSVSLDSHPFPRPQRRPTAQPQSCGQEAECVAHCSVCAQPGRAPLCQHGGECVAPPRSWSADRALARGYECDCAAGFEGLSCEAVTRSVATDMAWVAGFAVLALGGVGAAVVSRRRRSARGGDGGVQAESTAPATPLLSGAE